MAGSDRHQQIGVERLDEAHVDDRGIEPLGELERGAEQRPEHQERETAAAFATDHASTDRQRRHLRDGRRAIAHAARIAHGRGAAERGAGVEHLAALVLVGGRHEHHVRDAAQEGDVVGALMGGAIAADETGAIDREHDRQVLQRDIVHELVVGALQEGRVDRDHRLQALAGETCGESDGMLFGDRDIEIAFREAPRELDEA